MQWRNRVQSSILDDRIPNVEAIRKSLIDSQEGWRKRVEEKDVSNFTVAGRLKNCKFTSVSLFEACCIINVCALNFPARHSHGLSLLLKLVRPLLLHELLVL